MGRFTVKTRPATHGSQLGMWLVVGVAGVAMFFLVSVALGAVGVGGLLGVLILRFSHCHRRQEGRQVL